MRSDDTFQQRHGNLRCVLAFVPGLSSAIAPWEACALFLPRKMLAWGILSCK